MLNGLDSVRLTDFADLAVIDRKYVGMSKSTAKGALGKLQGSSENDRRTAGPEKVRLRSECRLRIVVDQDATLE